jgi:hypothetical protein
VNFNPSRTEVQEWNGSAWVCIDTVQSNNGSAQYGVQNMEGATRRFRIVAYVGGEAKAISNEFTITWKESVSAVWKGDTCTVTLEQPDLCETVMAAVYDDGQLVDIVKLTKKNPTAKLTGFLVKVFFVDDSNHPARSHVEF